MKIDKENGYKITLEEWIKCGYTERQYNYLREKGIIMTTGRACKNNEVEIILSSIPEDKRRVIIEHLGITEKEQKEALQKAVESETVSDIAIHNTAKSIELNAEYIRTELVAKIEKDYGMYLQYFFDYSINKESVTNYAKLCVVVQWLYERVLVIRSVADTPRTYNRYMRSLRSNFLEVRAELTVKKQIPGNDRVFAQWLEQILEKMDAGSTVQEVVEIKRQGNTNRQKFGEEQQKVAERIYCNGNLNDRQVYDRLLDVAKIQGWWTEKGKFEPITYKTLNNWLNENRNRLEIKRSDRIGFYTNVVPTINRSYPKEKNYVWGIDGTAHNEHTRVGNSIRQHTYTTYIFDYATFCLLNIGVSYRQEGESGELMVETLKEAIRKTGYKPYILQFDKGPGSRELEQWCIDNGIKTMPSQKGISRNKLIEQLLGQIQQQIINTLQGWNGQNRTARSRNSRPSTEFWEKGVSNARSYNQIKEWLNSEAIEIWNNHIVETMEGKPLGKTPNELWAEKESKTKPLPYESLLYLAGKVHEVKKTVDGIDIQYNKEVYRYVPDFSDVDKAADIWLAVKNGSKVKVYVGEYNKPVAVWQGNNYYGLWYLKERVSMVATFEGDTEEYNKQRAFQQAVEKNVKQQIEENRRIYEQYSYTNEVEEQIKKALPDSRRRGRLDKTELNEEEDQGKYQSVAQYTKIEEQSDDDYITMEVVDPDTGEVKRYKKRKK